MMETYLLVALVAGVGGVLAGLWWGRAGAALANRWGPELAAGAPDGVVVYDAKWNCRIWNNTMVVLSGITQPSALDAPFFEPFPCATDLRLEPLFRQALAGEAVCVPDVLCLGHGHQNQLWAEGRLSPILGAGGKILGVMGVFRDISERKRVELAARAEQMLLTDILDSIPAPVYYKNVEGFYLGCNAAFLTGLGVSREQVIGQSVLSFSPQEAAAHHVAMDQELLKNGGVMEYEMVVRDKDGVAHDAIVHKATFRNKQGQVAGIVGVMLEITKLKRTEEALRESQEQLNRIISAAQDAIIMLNPRGEISLWNESAARVLGYEAKDALGQPLHKLVIPERFQQECLREFARISCARQTSTPGQFAEVTAVRANGVEFPVELSLSPVQMRGEWHLVGIVRDITERKRAAQALQEMNSDLERATLRANELAVQAELASAAKSEFLANMSHEIRTPMNGVIGMTQLLLNTGLSPEQRQYTLLLRDSGQALLTLINDILDFSKIEARKMELEKLDFDLETTLEDTMEMLALRAQDKGLELVCLIDPRVPVALRGDPARLRQILLNLSSNAIKFTAQGGVTVRANLAEENETHALVRFEVTDTGIGIPAEKQCILFSPFTQVDGSTTRKYGGTGLGLAISKQLAELMDGHIGVESRDGHGSTFWFTALFVKQPAAAVAAEPSTLRGVRVLVADNFPDSRSAIKAMLDRWGCRSAEVAQGGLVKERLERAKGEGDPFQVALLDMRLPDVDSVELGCVIKRDPALAPTQLVMTGFINQNSDTPRLEKLGFAGFISKPFRRAGLLDCLKQALRLESRLVAPVSPKGASFAKHVKPGGGRWSVLLAEDNTINQMVAIKMLEHQGCRVEVASNGQEAIDALKRRAFDLVLMDCQMPEVDGFEATRRIRQGEPGVLTPQLPIIALTARALQGDREKCLQSGMDDYLTKPLEMDPLSEVLNRWLANPKAPPAPAPVSPPATLSTKPVAVIFDRADFMRRLMDDESLAAAMVESYLADMPAQLDKLKAAIAAGDADAAGKVAHRIKGASASMGAVAFRDAAHELETAGRAGDLAKVRSVYPELTRQFETLKKCLKPDW